MRGLLARSWFYRYQVYGLRGLVFQGFLWLFSFAFLQTWHQGYACCVVYLLVWLLLLLHLRIGLRGFFFDMLLRLRNRMWSLFCLVLLRHLLEGQLHCRIVFLFLLWWHLSLQLCHEVRLQPCMGRQRIFLLVLKQHLRDVVCNHHRIFFFDQNVFSQHSRMLFLLVLYLFRCYCIFWTFQLIHLLLCLLF